jgi:phenylacetate-CoA ligase
MNLHGARMHVHRYGRTLRDATAQLRESERWSETALTELQGRLLREVISTAYAQSPHYRKLMQERGLTPDAVSTVQDLRRLPLLTKDQVKEEADAIMTRSRPGPRWVHGHTSGTTGSPLGLWYDRHTCIMTNAVDRRQKAWAGMTDADWVGLFLGRVVVPLRDTRPPFWRVNCVQRQVWFSSFHMSDESLGAYVDEIRRRGLQFLEGYPSTLFVLARFVRRHVGCLPMTAVFTSSETLLPTQRSEIEGAFACSLFDYYGLAERVAFAGECEAHVGKHVSSEYSIVEVVDDDGQPVPDGTEGYLVGTSLHNRAMPMIRYRTGDRTSLSREPCPCGRTLPRIRDVTTKAEDILLTPDGRKISPSVLTHPFKPLDSIQASQIVQRELNRVTVRLVVKGAEFTSGMEAQLRAGLSERLGPAVEVDFEYVSSIPRTASGKLRWVVSLVQHDASVEFET